MIYPDEHIHSHFSADTDEKIENYLNKALELGLTHITFTNHLDYDYRNKGEDWKFDPIEEKIEIDSLKDKYPTLYIGQGVELGYRKHRLKDIIRFAHSYDFDVINYSSHYDPGIDYFKPEEFYERGIDETMHIYFATYIEMLGAFTDFDVLSHIDYAYKTVTMIDPSISLSRYEEEITKILKRVIELDKVLEINTKVEEKIDDDNHVRYLLRLYKSLGGKHLTLNSDAHEAERLCSSFPRYIKIIKEEGFDHLCYFIKRKRYEYIL